MASSHGAGAHALSDGEIARVEIGAGYFVTADGYVYSTKSGAPHRLCHTYCRGYAYVTIYRESGREKHQVHALVLAAFKGDRPSPNYCCRHLDGDKSNNRITNLEWGTPKENGRDMVIHGASPRGGRNGQAKLTTEQVLEIRRLYDARQEPHVIARHFPVTRDQARHIGRRESWCWVPEENPHSRHAKSHRSGKLTAREASAALAFGLRA